MKIKILLAFIGFAILLSGYILVTKFNDQQTYSHQKMLQAVNDMLGLLDEEQKEIAMFEFEDEERQNWHFIPRERPGVMYREMTESQKKQVEKLLQIVLSEDGYIKAREIMLLEEILRELENRPADDDRRDPEKYHLSIFGQPGDGNPWGWRFEGHHLSLNFSSLSGAMLASTPLFYGTNPARIPSGPREGERVLKAEEDIARQLMALLSSGQKKIAVIDAVAPNDVITSSDRKVTPFDITGLAYAKMNEGQQKKTDELIDIHLGKLDPKIAKDLYRKIDDSRDAIHFAWAGTEEIGEAHYYRLHHPKLLIEYDNSQNDANHVHTVVRDIENDFGEDVLKKHYETSDHHH
jgi:hypothetical protein